MFSQQHSLWNLSLDELVIRLNLVTGRMHTEITSLSSPQLKKDLNYLLYATSVDDPYQFKNINNRINEELTTLEKQAKRQKIITAGCATAFGASFIGFLNDKSFFLVALAALGVTANRSKHTYHILTEIETLNKIKQMITDNDSFNLALSCLLLRERRDIKQERAEYYIQQIVPTNPKTHEEKKFTGSFLMFDLKKSFWPSFGRVKMPEKMPTVTLKQ